MGGSSTPRGIPCASSTSTVHIYEALEAVSEHYRAEPSPITGPFTHPGLDRAEYIPRSNRALGQDGDIDAPCPQPQNVERIRATINFPERTCPPLPALPRRPLRRPGQSQRWSPATTASPAEALSMYRFIELPKPRSSQDGYRELLDNAPLTDEQREAPLKSASKAFRINASLFAQLGRKVAEA